MFCTNCGKEIIDTAKFCNFCGMPVKNMAASVPITPSEPVRAEVQSVPQPEQSFPDYTESADVPVSEPVYEAPETSSEIPTAESAPEAPEYEAEPSELTEEPAEPSVEADIPTPNTIPTYGASAPAYSAVNPPVNTVITQEIRAEVPEAKPERMYTLGHIMMCLAAVAVMAIVAGVFAGLYFSVV
ncbi:MAG: zinc-ribbon domain-containing protein [Ruminococcaceae bacterium]|nr:zinc-ribbon domain-containing protein [Oscillospiraceae bacterium]